MKYLDLYFDVGDNIEEGKFKNALSKMMNFVKSIINILIKMYWTLINTNQAKCNEVIYNHYR